MSDSNNRDVSFDTIKRVGELLEAGRVHEAEIGFKSAEMINLHRIANALEDLAEAWGKKPSEGTS